MAGEPIVLLYKEVESDLQNGMVQAQNIGCNGLITSIVNPQFTRKFRNDTDPHSLGHARFTRSDLLLDTSDWTTKIVIRLTESIDCDSAVETVRKYGESVIRQEMAFAQYVATAGCIMLKIHGTNTHNLATVVASSLKGTTLMVEIPMVDPKSQRDYYISDDVAEPNDTWKWWHTFRSSSEYHPRIVIALEVSADLPSKEEILRWLGEPVQLLIVPSNVFITNAHNYPVLSKAHQSVVSKFLSKTDCKFVVKGTMGMEMHRLQNHVEYLRKMCKDIEPDCMGGYDDLLEIPLQPLYDNLDAYTYESFEKDPVKYIQYQRAIEAALKDKIPADKRSTTTAVVMVAGAGRGPLIRSAINASTNVGIKIKIIAVEKNPNAIVTLTALKEEMWPDEDLTIYAKDMRDMDLSEKADILVSELLGSFGDNELSPECLDAAQRHLKSDGISIPCKSTSYLNPVMSPRLHNAVHDARGYLHRTKPTTANTNAESSYVVYLRNIFHITEPKAAFTFVHPNRNEIIDNNRFVKLEFKATQDCVLTGFAGYFDTVLYNDIVLSTHPLEHTQGLISWFSMYFPLQSPQYVRAGEKICVNFWRCVSSIGVWYQWNTSEPQLTHIHNLKGRAHTINK